MEPGCCGKRIPTGWRRSCTSFSNCYATSPFCTNRSCPGPPIPSWIFSRSRTSTGHLNTWQRSQTPRVRRRKRYGAPTRSNRGPPLANRKGCFPESTYRTTSWHPEAIGTLHSMASTKDELTYVLGTSFRVKYVHQKLRKRRLYFRTEVGREKNLKTHDQ